MLTCPVLTWPADLAGTAVRLRLVGCERLRRRQFLGQAELRCGADPLRSNQPLWLTLKPHPGTTVRGKVLVLSRGPARKEGRALHHRLARNEGLVFTHFEIFSL